MYLPIFLSFWTTNIHACCFFPPLPTPANQDFNHKLHACLPQLPLRSLSSPYPSVLTWRRGTWHFPVCWVERDHIWSWLLCGFSPMHRLVCSSQGWRLLSLPLSYALSFLSSEVLNFFRRRISTLLHSFPLRQALVISNGGWSDMDRWRGGKELRS